MDFYSTEVVQYSKMHDCLGVYSVLDKSLIMASNCAPFELVALNEYDGALMFCPLSADKYEHDFVADERVSVYLADGMVWFWGGKHSKSQFLAARFVYWFLDALTIILLGVTVALLFWKLIIEVIDLRKLKPKTARCRKVRCFHKEKGFDRDIFFVDGLTTSTVVVSAKTSVNENGISVSISEDLFCEVDKVYDADRAVEINPVEGQTVTAVKVGTKWWFVAGELSASEVIKIIRVRQFKRLCSTVLVFALVVLVWSFLVRMAN